MTISRRQAFALAGSAVAASAVPASVLAQVGAAPIKIVFPFAAGGGGDALCRFVADQMSKRLGRPVIVENRTGADGRIGIQAVKAAPPDGETLLITTGPTMALMPLLHKAAGYDPATDFEPISQLAEFEFCLVVANSTPAKTVAELVGWAKANPDKATYAVPGLGTLPHFAGVTFSKQIGVDMRRLAYRGGAPAMNDLVAGQIPMGFMTLADAIEQHRSGTVRIIATLGRSRSPFLPNLPTMIEEGHEVEALAWYGLWAPARTAKDVIDKLGAAVRAGVNSEEGKSRLTPFGMIARGTAPDGLVAASKRLVDTWATVIKASGFSIEQ